MTKENDVAPMTTPENEKASLSTQPNKLFLLILLIFGVIMIMGIFYLNGELEDLQVEDKKLRQEITAAQFKLAQNVSSIDKLTTGLTHQSHQEQVTQQALQETIQQLFAKMSNEEESWRLQDAQELIRLAKLQLAVTQSIPTAMELLNAADEQIRHANDVRLQALREAIAQDRLALESAANVDIAGGLAQINAIRLELPNLAWPLNYSQQQALAADTSASQDEPVVSKKNSWRDNFWASIDFIKQFLIIRRNNTVEDHLLDTAGKNNVILLVDMTLLKADFGLLRHNDSLFIDSIQQAQQVIERYFDTKDERTKAVLEQLHGLQDMSLKAQLPSLDSSLNATRDAITRFKEPQLEATIVAPKASSEAAPAKVENVQ